MKIKIFGVLCLMMLIFVFFSGCQENGGNIPEIGDIEFSPLSPVIYENVTFSIDNAESLSGQGLTFTWDFGDESIDDSDKSVTYRYAEAGNYTVKLVVSDGVSSVEKYVDVSVGDSSIYSFDVDFSLPGGWNTKARIINSTGLDYRLELPDQDNVYIIIYNNSEDTFYETLLGVGIWDRLTTEYPKYVSYSDTYTVVVDIIAYELKGVKIGENSTINYMNGIYNIHINDVNCVFSNDLFTPPSNEEVR